MASDSSPPPARRAREVVYRPTLNLGRLSSLDRRSFRLRYSDSDAARPQDSIENRSTFGLEGRRSLDRSSFRLRYDDYGAESDEQSSDDEDPGLNVSFSQTVPREFHSRTISNAFAESSGGGGRQNGYAGEEITLSVPNPLEEEELPDEDEGIGWISEQDMPPVNKEFKKKASVVLKAALTIIDDYDNKEEEEERKKSCSGIALSCFFNGDFCQNIPSPGPLSVKPISQKLKKAQKIGLKLGKKLLFPAIPKLLRDLWVGVELAAGIVQFILGCLQLNFEDNIAYGITVFVLTVISFSLGLMDGWTYFYSMGSCHDCHESIKKHRSGKGSSEEKENLECTNTEEEEGNDQPKTKWQKVRMKWQKAKGWLDESLELLRTVLSELLLYPLIMFDLIELLTSDFDVSTSQSQVGFSLFLLGGLFLILSVYIVRFMIISTTILQLNRMPVTCLKKQDHVMTITRFLIHVFMQVIVHFLCIVAVGVKIKQENLENMTHSVFLSPFLWYTMAAGWVIPFLGILSFFVVKYYWLEEFSAGMYLDMISMLQTQGFAEAVFHSQATELASDFAGKFSGKIGDTKNREEEELRISVLAHKNPGFRATEEETETALVDDEEEIVKVDYSAQNAEPAQTLQDTSKEYMKKIDFTNTIQEFETRQEDTSYIYKFLYPLKIPFFALFALFYDAVFLSFCVCLCLTSDGQGEYRVSVFDGGNFSISLIVCVVFILIGNLNVLITINLWIVTTFVGSTILLPFLPCIAYLMYRYRKRSQATHESGLQIPPHGSV